MMRLSIVLPLARSSVVGLCLGLAAAVASAALFEDDEARKAILDLRNRVEAVRLYAETVNQKLETQRQSVELLNQNMDAVRQAINALRIGAESDRADFKQGGGRATEEVAILRRSLLGLQNQIEQLRSDAAQMRGVNEQLLRELSEGQRRQKDIAQALDERFRATTQGLDERFRATAQGFDERLRTTAQGMDERLRATEQGMEERFRAVEPVKVSLDGREFMADQVEKRDFEAALALFRKAEFAAAQTAFFDFLSRYSRSGYAPSALYWLGNAQYATRDYKEAMVNFRALIARAPDHMRTPEALLSVANCQVELKDARGARKTLEELVSAYPKSEAAAAAKGRLARLK